MKPPLNTNYWEKTLSFLNQGKEVFLAMVVDHTAHSPGTTGAKICVAKNEIPFGTVGGGIMEYNLLQRAKDILENGQFTPEIQTLVHQKTSPEEKSGMICAGKQTNLYYLCHPEKDKETVEKIVACLNQNQPALLSISLSGMTIKNGPTPSQESQFKLLQTEHDWRYEEHLQNFKRMAILGGGHCSLALSRVMNQLGYDVLVFDTRNNVSTVEVNKFAESVQIVEDYKNAAGLIGYPELTQVVVMTTDVASDVQGILGVIQFPFPFIGVMGSAAKISEIKKRLLKGGISEEQLNKLTAPVGLPIASNTPEEIAISVAAQILQKREQDEN